MSAHKWLFMGGRAIGIPLGALCCPGTHQNRYGDRLTSPGSLGRVCQQDCVEHTAGKEPSSQSPAFLRGQHQ